MTGLRTPDIIVLSCYFTILVLKEQSESGKEGINEAGRIFLFCEAIFCVTLLSNACLIFRNAAGQFVLFSSSVRIDLIRR